MEIWVEMEWENLLIWKIGFIQLVAPNQSFMWSNDQCGYVRLSSWTECKQGLAPIYVGASMISKIHRSQLPKLIVSIAHSLQQLKKIELYGALGIEILRSSILSIESQIFFFLKKKRGTTGT